MEKLGAFIIIYMVEKSAGIFYMDEQTNKKAGLCTMEQGGRFS